MSGEYKIIKENKNSFHNCLQELIERERTVMYGDNYAVIDKDTGEIIRENYKNSRIIFEESKRYSQNNINKVKQLV